MRRLHHPAVLPLLCSFVEGPELWLVMPYMEASHCRRGMDEDGAATRQRPGLALMTAAWRACATQQAGQVLGRSVQQAAVACACCPSPLPSLDARRAAAWRT